MANIPKVGPELAAVATRVGAGGSEWSGVRIECDVQYSDVPRLRVEVEYLTRSSSNLLAIVTRWINGTPAAVSASAEVGLDAWLRVGGSPQNTILHWESEGIRHRRGRGSFMLAGGASN